MRVRSPIGDLPFTVTGVHRGGAGIVVDGELGAWASQVEIGPSDVPMLARALRGPLRRRRRGRRRGAVPGEPAVSRDVLIGIDQGTSGTRTVAFDLRLRPLADAYRPAEVSHPQPGWIEKDADETVRTVEESLAEVVAAVGADRIAAVGLDNEGETVVAWDAERPASRSPRRSSGAAAARSRSSTGWRRPATARRSSASPGCRSIPTSPRPRSAGWSRTCRRSRRPRTRAACGPARWTRTCAPGWAAAPARSRRPPGERSCRRSGGAGSWDPDSARLHGVDEAWLPPIGDSAGDFGELAGQPLRGLLVDQTASLAGHGCLAEGMAKATYGTGIFLLQNAGERAAGGAAGVLPIIAWTLGGRTTYALDGGVFSAGTVVAWLRDGIGIIESPAETAALAESVPDAGGVRFLPRWPGWARRGGVRTRGRSTRGSRRARRGRTWCGRRWTRWRSASATSSRRCPRGRRRCASTAG